MPFALARSCIACGLLFVGASFGLAAADAAPNVNPDGEITLAEAIDAALRSSPELLASAYELTAAQARIVQAGLRPNPELGVELENFAGSGALRGASGLETTLSLGQVVEMGDKRRLRQSAAEAGLDLITIEQRAKELDVLSEVTRRFIDVVVAQERVRFATEATGLADRTLGAIGARVDAGRSPEAERSRARIAVTRAQVAQRQARGELRSARYALAALWGSAEPAFTSSKADLFDLRSAEPFGTLMERLERSPDFVRFVSETRLREAELRLARAQARPNLGLTLGVRRLEESNEAALVAGFSMPLGLNDRNQGAIREAQARITQSDTQRDAARVKARASLFGLYEQMTAARERADIVRNEAIPQAQQAVDQTASGYERGRFSFLELVSVQEELLALREAAIDAAADYHRLGAEIERLTSEPLNRPASPNQLR